MESRNSLDLKDLPALCNGCGEEFTLQHALSCKEGGLVAACHNNLNDKIIGTAVAGFCPSHVRIKPKINPFCQAELKRKEKAK